MDNRALKGGEHVDSVQVEGGLANPHWRSLTDLCDIFKRATWSLFANKALKSSQALGLVECLYGTMPSRQNTFRTLRTQGARGHRISLITDSYQSE